MATTKELGRQIGRALRGRITKATSECGHEYPIRPIGALTSKPYAFTSRSWELKSTESIDIFDGVGSNIRIDTRGSEIMRVLPRLNEEINEEWISDKSRFAYDGLKRQRLNTPMVRFPDGDLKGVTWERARAMLKNRLMVLDRENVDGFESVGVLGPYVDVAAALELRQQIYRWFPNGRIIVQEQPRGIPTDFRYGYMMNTPIARLEESDFVLLIGADPRKEAPLLNARIRKAVMYQGARVVSVGCATDLTYQHEHLGNSMKTVKDIAEGNHSICEAMKQAEKPVVMVSNRALQREDGPVLYRMVEAIAKHGGAISREWDGFCVLHQGANTVGLLDIGFDDKYDGLRALDKDKDPWKKTKFLYLMGADDIDGLEDLPKDCLVVYQGHHGDRGASMADIILPGAAYTEKSSTYVNTEGRVQRSKLAFFPPGQARNDAEILRDLMGADEHADKYTNSAGLLEVLAPHLSGRSHLEVADRVLGDESIMPKVSPEELKATKISDVPFQPPIDNFYMTDPITRSSKTMAKCTRVRKVSNFDINLTKIPASVVP
eukprot:Plantae.Rhodophyta-Hildenbrandia_rubra.ctg4223.p1 GENE.Plantae.Rhodophyta-Hildenbrandia_rubra.ctg4223~~Plantae.Rhodophyta-Hildenbrandia_rubra.ctg4223.p1  ORF type:complete len:574 (+),score=111.13 Plantae.Rhodophyta-Hildenbrandia_rubra.ctg4223:81-1724(+)